MYTIIVQILLVLSTFFVVRFCLKIWFADKEAEAVASDRARQLITNRLNNGYYDNVSQDEIDDDYDAWYHHYLHTS